jgi:GT2 family glycosyltransferase
LACKLLGDEVRECQLADLRCPLKWSSVSVDKETPCTYVPGVALHRRKCLEELGGFDERYFLGYQDADYSLRLVKSNKKVLYTPRVAIVHKHDKSNEVYNEIRKNPEHRRNSLRVFNEKWGRDGSDS